jgi:hypothetical protein
VAKTCFYIQTLCKTTAAENDVLSRGTTGLAPSVLMTIPNMFAAMDELEQISDRRDVNKVRHAQKSLLG